jgi:Kef-type K+ transport system membrane component KefB
MVQLMKFDSRFLEDVSVALFGAALGGMLAASVHLPPNVGYMLGGAVVGPSGLTLVSKTDYVRCGCVVCRALAACC